ncbi:MAG: hypothetical protein JXA03_07405, partial [Bacteroidales bacterium]|nr:hypothetical protein [Bacteroidales bacterium]
MKNGRFYIIFLFYLLVLGCQKENNQYIPRFDIVSKKTDGLTTDIFSISINPTTNTPTDEKLHCRWDWDGDSIFNTRFSDELEVNHRFLQPGQYKVICEVLSLNGQKTRNSLIFNIQQGYSPPKANFIVEPETGHFKTDFFFDAS